MTASHVRSRLRLVLVLSALGLPGCVGPVAPDLVIVNAKVFTNDTARPWAEAIAIKGERVIAVGATADLRASAGPATRMVDAGGRVLVPGFNDARVDLPLELPTPELLSSIDRAAIARGVTSLQVVAGGPMRTLVPAAQQAQRQARWRVIRSPLDTAMPSTGTTAATAIEDEDPYLPPQPGIRLVANGVAWSAAPGVAGRHGLEVERTQTVAGWAYGAEDPMVMEGAATRWLVALSNVGLPAVWQRKRPRLDVDHHWSPRDLDDLEKFGVVVTLLTTPRPTAVPQLPLLSFDGDATALAFSLAPCVDAGVVVAAGTGGPRSRMDWRTIATGEVETAGGGRARAATREEAVRAATWGSAYAEKAERDKGWLGPGTLADIAVLSDDIFTVPAERLSAITSVLTVVGGAIVYDPGVLSK